MAIISNGTTIASGGSLSVSANPPSTAGAVGTYALLSNSETGTDTAGTTRNSGLQYANAEGGTGGGVSGTWRLMGRTVNANPNGYRCSVFIRIS